MTAIRTAAIRTAAIRSAAMLLLLPASLAAAHPLAPALLDLRESGNGETAVLWKTPLARPAGADIRPVFPPDCTSAHPLTVEPEPDALRHRGTLRCSGSWIGRTIRVEGLAAGGTNALVRVALADGRVARGLLSGEHPAFVVPEAPSRLALARDHLALGVEHLVTGFDHVLFVLGLLLLVRGGARLAWTVTAFTAGHSVTLAAAVLGFVAIPAGPVEILIALSLVLLAAEIGRPRESVLARRPAIFAGSFGLLHGLGFAGALAGAGLPAGEIPLALVSFNAGIEAGQLAIVTAALAIAAAARRLGAPELPPAAAAYGIGILAARWVLERANALAFG